MEYDSIRQIVRGLIILILISSAIVTKFITKSIGNIRLSKMANNLFKILIFFIFLRISSIFLDTYFSPDLGIFSTLVGIIFYLYIFYILFNFYKNLNIVDKNVDTGQGSIIYSKRINNTKVSNLIDELFDELKLNKNKAEVLHNSIEKELKQYE